MPVRKRRDGRKQSASLDDWESVFEFGFDMFSDLHYAGIALDKNRCPDREEALAAWQRHGDAFLSTFDGPKQPWALAEFGEPR